MIISTVFWSENWPCVWGSWSCQLYHYSFWMLKWLLLSLPPSATWQDRLWILTLKLHPALEHTVCTKKLGSDSASVQHLFRAFVFCLFCFRLSSSGSCLLRTPWLGEHFILSCKSFQPNFWIQLEGKFGCVLESLQVSNSIICIYLRLWKLLKALLDVSFPETALGLVRLWPSVFIQNHR